MLPPHNAGLHATLRREQKAGPSIGYDLLTSTFRDESNTRVLWVSTSDSRIEGGKNSERQIQFTFIHFYSLHVLRGHVFLRDPVTQKITMKCSVKSMESRTIAKIWQLSLGRVVDLKNQVTASPVDDCSTGPSMKFDQTMTILADQM